MTAPDGNGMAARRWVVVLSWPRGSTLQNAVVISLAAHVVFAIAALTLPSLRGRPAAPLPTLDVVLVSPLLAPEPPAPAPPAPRPTATEPEPPRPPEGPSATPELPPEKPVEKPKEKKPEPPKKAAKPPEPARPPETVPSPPAGQSDPDPLASQAPEGPPGPIGAAAGGALEGMGVEFNWYRDAVIRALSTAWRQPFAANMLQPLEVTIAFEIGRDGNVRGARIAEPSGNAALDRSALRAVLEAQLPPLPRNHGGNSQPALFVFHLDPQSP